MTNTRGPGTIASNNSGVLGSKKLQGSKIKGGFGGNNTGLINTQIGVNQEYLNSMLSPNMIHGNNYLT
jgi:hypothetical protein